MILSILYALLIIILVILIVMLVGGALFALYSDLEPIGKIIATIIIAIIIGLSIFIGGKINENNKNKITSGEISSLELKEAYTYTQLMPMKVGDVTTYIPFVYHYPERYAVTIKKYKNDSWEYATYYVKQHEFNELMIGQEFEFNKETQLDEKPYTRTKEE